MLKFAAWENRFHQPDAPDPKNIQDLNNLPDTIEPFPGEWLNQPLDPDHSEEFVRHVSGSHPEIPLRQEDRKGVFASLPEMERSNKIREYAHKVFKNGKTGFEMMSAQHVLAHMGTLTGKPPNHRHFKKRTRQPSSKVMKFFKPHKSEDAENATTKESSFKIFCNKLNGE